MLKNITQGFLKTLKSFDSSGIAAIPILIILALVGILIYTRVFAQTTDTTSPSYPCCGKPDPMEVVTGNVTIEPNIYDESGIAKVELRFRDRNDPINVRGNEFVYYDTEVPYQFPWDSRNLPDGRQRYDIQAWDIYNNQDGSHLASGFLAMNDPTYPPISVVSPLPGSTVTGIATIEFSTSADNGIVAIYVDEEKAGSFTSLGEEGYLTLAKITTSPYRFDWNSNSYSDGSHRFRVRSFEQDKFSPGDLGDPGELIFALCVRSCTQPTPTPTPSPTQTPTPTISAYGTITGTIYSSTGQLVSGAKITLRVNNKNTTYTSNAQGKYIIPNLPPGTYSITYVAAGYSQQKTTATITAGQTLVINVTLKPK